MFTPVGVKVFAEMVAVAAVLTFLVGLALRGRARESVTGWSAAFIGLAGLVLLVEVLFGLLDINRTLSGAVLLVFGAGWMVYQRRRSTLV
jgi:hypothetical protein